MHRATPSAISGRRWWRSIAGVERKVHYFVLDLPHSDGCFVKAYPGGDHRGLSGRPRVGLRLAGRVAPEHSVRQYQAGGGPKILGHGRRKRTRAFTELQSHYLFEDRFGRPGKGNDKGNDKGNVEGMVGYARRNFLVPIPRGGEFSRR